MNRDTKSTYTPNKKVCLQNNKHTEEYKINSSLRVRRIHFYNSIIEFILKRKLYSVIKNEV